jgi:hypothetical protein
MDADFIDSTKSRIGQRLPCTKGAFDMGQTCWTNWNW